MDPSLDSGAGGAVVVGFADGRSPHRSTWPTLLTASHMPGDVLRARKRRLADRAFVISSHYSVADSRAVGSRKGEEEEMVVVVERAVKYSEEHHKP